MGSRGGDTVDFVVLTLTLLLSTASAEGWFYPNETDIQVELPASWSLTGALMIRLDSPESPLLHADIESVEWLTRRPAVARVNLKAGADPLEVSRDLHGRDGVQWAHPDIRLPIVTHTLPNDPMVGDQWHLENTGQVGSPGTDVNAEEAWEYSTGAGQLIAIIDSGTDPDHPDLAVVNGYDYVDGDDDSYPADGNAHGTACAGLAAGQGDNGIGVAGVAYDAEVYGIRFIGSDSSESFYDAFTEAVDAGATVLSNSWGVSNACTGFSLPAAYTAAMDYAEEEGRGGLGTVIVFAAGNDDCDISNDGFLAGEHVVGVAAVSSSDIKEWYSSYGDLVDISAPSGGVVTTDISGESGYGSHQGDEDYTGSMSGTSASTPIVAGVFALMFSANDRLTAADARDILCQTATRNDILDADYDESGWSPYYGCGRVDAGAAVAAVANSAPNAPASEVPDASVYEDRIWLDWSAATDPDSDRLTYRVVWSVDGGEPVETIVDGLSLELTDEAEAGQSLTWQVGAIDLWGDGPMSPEYTQTVIARPVATAEESGGCQAAAGGIWWLGLMGLFGRRRNT
ncbi:MAG: subtilisin family serine protease [Myxococcota bacterium]|jgi:subtilisin family serine protease